MRRVPAHLSDPPHLGTLAALNCAACHTGEITYPGKTLRVEGAPSLADFQGFTDQLRMTLAETTAYRGKFDRFAQAVFGSEMSVETRTVPEAQQKEYLEWQTRLQDKNNASVRYGFGRLDARRHILNKVALVAEAADQLREFPATRPRATRFSGM